MKKINRKGFTLVELIAVVVILSLIVGIGATAITEVIKKNKEDDYFLLIDSIKNAMESYYHECKYVTYECFDSGTVELGDLVSKGFLKGNSTIKTGDNKGKFTLVNPVYVKKSPDDSDIIYECKIKYEYKNGKISIEPDGLGENYNGPCPKEY